jgi:GNAT superfamily N-acetyltransferase
VLLLGREDRANAGRALLRELAPRLPSRFYAHLIPGIVDLLGASVTIEPHGLHDRMILGERSHIGVVDTRAAQQLGPSDREELLGFYRQAYPSNWFDARMLETHSYFGVRHEGRLASVAGVHVVSRSYNVAALGNVATAPEHRGRGFARIATAVVCKALDEIDAIGLNVESVNRGAIALYESLGFERVASYDEALVTLR